MEISRAKKIVLARGAFITVKVASARYWRLALVQGELEITHFAMVEMLSTTVTNNRILNLTTEFVNIFYQNPVRSLFLDSFIEDTE